MSEIKGCAPQGNSNQQHANGCSGHADMAQKGRGCAPCCHTAEYMAVANDNETLSHSVPSTVSNKVDRDNYKVPTDLGHVPVRHANQACLITPSLTCLCRMRRSSWRVVSSFFVMASGSSSARDPKSACKEFLSRVPWQGDEQLNGLTQESPATELQPTGTGRSMTKVPVATAT